MNTHAKKACSSELFAQMVEAITDLMFSVDACDPDTYHSQRVGGNWEILLHSVRSAVRARAEGKGAPDCRIRASVVRTHLNAEHVDSGRMEEFWKGKLGVDWMSISECYFPAGQQHHKAVHWRQMSADEFQCRLFPEQQVTWDGRHTTPPARGPRSRSTAGRWCACPATR
jgi:hypothetical protein